MTTDTPREPEPSPQDMRRATPRLTPQLLARQRRRAPTPSHPPPAETESTWDLIKDAPRDDKIKLAQADWEKLEHEMRAELTLLLNARTPGDKYRARDLRDLAQTANVCKSNAYPESMGLGIPIHIPARLLASLRTVLKPVEPLGGQAGEEPGEASPTEPPPRLLDESR